MHEFNAPMVLLQGNWAFAEHCIAHNKVLCKPESTTVGLEHASNLPTLVNSKNLHILHCNLVYIPFLTSVQGTKLVTYQQSHYLPHTQIPHQSRHAKPPMPALH